MPVMPILRAMEPPLLPRLTSINLYMHKMSKLDTPSQNGSAHVKDSQISLITDDLLALSEAIKNGLGLGFMSVHDAAKTNNLRVIIPPTYDSIISVWMVTHIDLHRTIKVQSFTQHLKAHASQLSYD